MSHCKDREFHEYFTVRKGIKTTLTDEMIEKIAAAIPLAYKKKHVASLVMIPLRTLEDWLKKGEEDMLCNNLSIYAKLVCIYNLTVSKLCAGLLEDIKGKHWKADLALLGFADETEFGSKSSEMKQLIDNVNKISSLRAESEVKVEKQDDSAKDFNIQRE